MWLGVQHCRRHRDSDSNAVISRGQGLRHGCSPLDPGKRLLVVVRDDYPHKTLEIEKLSELIKTALNFGAHRIRQISCGETTEIDTYRRHCRRPPRELFHR